MFIFGAVCGAAVVGVLWWIDRRSLKGVISDLNDAKSVAKGVKDKLSA